MLTITSPFCPHTPRVTGSILTDPNSVVCPIQTKISIFEAVSVPRFPPQPSCVHTNRPAKRCSQCAGGIYLAEFRARERFQAATPYSYASAEPFERHWNRLFISPNSHTAGPSLVDVGPVLQATKGFNAKPRF